MTAVRAGSRPIESRCVDPLSDGLMETRWQGVGGLVGPHRDHARRVAVVVAVVADAQRLTRRKRIDTAYAPAAQDVARSPVVQEFLAGTHRQFVNRRDHQPRWNVSGAHRTLVPTVVEICARTVERSEAAPIRGPIVDQLTPGKRSEQRESIGITLFDLGLQRMIDGVGNAPPSRIDVVAVKPAERRRVPRPAIRTVQIARTQPEHREVRAGSARSGQSLLRAWERGGARRVLRRLRLCGMVGHCQLRLSCAAGQGRKALFQWILAARYVYLE